MQRVFAKKMVGGKRPRRLANQEELHQGAHCSSHRRGHRRRARSFGLRNACRAFTCVPPAWVIVEAAQKVCWNQNYLVGIQTTASESPVLEPSTKTANAAGVAATLEVAEGRGRVQQGAFFALT